ncbi:hypothetical protein NLM31_21910 [Bradyrhizobium sp. CCGUVB4N]|uniref:hypothetical protein n=1 Tax=Bradyrhizobium sp. CCGUVB4N TaxID=2949631 RepID=UPI0020B32884|nr:hypothetical protein [Bradyrhizobium sp. CCGUVB4N]MCP3383027.1 hypothetical protein [Bradyrhizobium sp. CCGUVB4N]
MNPAPALLIVSSMLRKSRVLRAGRSSRAAIRHNVADFDLGIARAEIIFLLSKSAGVAGGQRKIAVESAATRRATKDISLPLQ